MQINEILFRAFKTLYSHENTLVPLLDLLFFC